MMRSTFNARPSTWLQLPLSFDVRQMQRDSSQFIAGDWIKHFNTGAYEYGWSCVPLRSPGGEAAHIVPINEALYADTPQLLRCPYLRTVIDQFRCNAGAVRLMALAPGAVIHAHRDAGTALMDGLTRIHIPIQTSPQVLFSIDGESVHFTAGHAWYMDASCLHAVENRGMAPRIHLVIDCLTNAWLQALFARAGFVPKAAARYGDPSINDGNVHAVITQLRASATPATQAMADRLATLAQGSGT
ncbi:MULTISPECIES: aspartyl/asparaginyl beta-hydroxylase domain-containing protein [unclassified Janthinobacterium]|uniref:aspartyl/asparaginyl beta-hydroxylase domain-containing protein n=1 Tax=unclassified Janthinobacterium TaxID=2610881 RepID=UPI00161A3350|nr:MULTISPECIES: aspartyl/asparaginyl beta-hydroxylase domain-containing protein [unclassified Janthinobacterium]MBB5610118.1 quercetin dioxygenase-like cupin family protein [Janthinobacterium sp. S3T4]MBB5615532.1 quercetin dioxygenase-like cupin family protein [Janthinobacterium sp. S3M3]